MSRRIDIELTSALDDGSWTWRAAGARHPKGVVPGSVLPDGVKIGDELKVEVEQEIDGITILGVVHGRAKPERVDVIELLPAERDFQPVVETRAPGGRRRDDDRPRRGRRDDGEGRGDRRPRRDGERAAPREGAGRDGAPRDGAGRGDAGRGDAGRGAGRAGGGRGDGERRPRRDGADRPRRGPSFTPPPEIPQRPKPQRLKPGKAHRATVLGELPEEQRSIAELALQGLAAVRQKVRDENQKAVAEGRATMPEATVMKMAEELLPKLRVAEWRDRAEAAQKQLANLDLRDLRSVVAAANDPIVVRDETTRALATELTEGLATRQEQELLLWFGDVDAALAVGRVVRALRLSSQPPKAGVPFPADIAQRLVDSANAALAPMDPPERWIAMLEAAAFSPVRSQIKPLRKPDVVNDELTATVTRLAPALPQVAELFGVEVDPKAAMPKPLRPGPRPGSKDAKSERGDKARGDRKPQGEAGRDKPRKQAGPATPEAAAAAPATDAADTGSAPENTETAAAPPTPEPTETSAPESTETPAAPATPEPTEASAVPEANTGAPDIADVADTPDAPVAETPDTPDGADTPDTPVAETPDVADATPDTVDSADTSATSTTTDTSLGDDTSPDTPVTGESADAADSSAATETPQVTDTTAATATAHTGETPRAADTTPAADTADHAPTRDSATSGTADVSDVVETEIAAESPQPEATTAPSSEVAAGPDAAHAPATAAQPAGGTSEAPATDADVPEPDTAAQSPVDSAFADLLDTAAGEQLLTEARAVEPESAAVEANAEALAAVEHAADELDR